jgi:DNA repair exonuclease SbcCD ATPase subunit
VGFIQDFGPKKPTAGHPPQASTPHARPQASPDGTAAPRERGFFADFKPKVDPATQDVFLSSATAHPNPVPLEHERPVQRASSQSWSSDEQVEPATLSTSTNAPRTLWDDGTSYSRQGPSSFEVETLANEVKNVSERLQALGGTGSESRITKLEHELSSTRQSLSQAKEAVHEKRAKYQRAESFLERNKRMVSRMESRMSGYGASDGWGRGHGGGRWRSHHNDEFLFTREELRGPENADERKAQMGLVLDSRRERVWALQDEVSASRTAYSNAESRIRELEQKLGRIQGELSQARQSFQNKKEQKSSLREKLGELKSRYHKLTGRTYGNLF